MRPPRRQNGFTLVEITAVVLILGIMAAAVALNVRQPMARARLEEVLDRIGHFDATVRTAALRQGRSFQMVADLSQGRLACLGSTGEPEAASVSLPPAFRIERIVTPLHRADSGQVAIRYGSQGLSPSYGLLVSGSGGRRWIVILGLTGQLVEADDEQTVVDILAGGRGVHPG